MCRSLSAARSSFADSSFSRCCVRNGPACLKASIRAQACRVRCQISPNEPRTLQVRSCERFPSVHRKAGRSCTLNELWQGRCQRCALPHPPISWINVPGFCSQGLLRRKLNSRLPGAWRPAKLLQLFDPSRPVSISSSPRAGESSQLRTLRHSDPPCCRHCCP